MFDPTPEPALTPVDRELEAALARLAPRADGLDRDGLLWAAGRAEGQAEARRSLWRLRGAAGLLAAACVALAVPLVRQPATPAANPLGNDAANPAPQLLPALAGEPGPPGEVTGPYLQLRELVLTQGVDALPQPKGDPPAPAPTLADLLRQS